MLEISHISKKYGSKEALHDVSLTLPRGGTRSDARFV